MSFKTRNLYYLRISEQAVLPVYVYLDERHLEWMSDRVLQHVLSDLRPRILSKLITEGTPTTTAALKRATVDTHRGDTYQFCYFLRRTDSHSVVIKTRNYVARNREQTRAHGSRSLASSHDERLPNASSTSDKGSRANVWKKRKTTSDSSPPSRSAKKQRPMELDGLETPEEAQSHVLAQDEVSVIDVDQDEDMVDNDMEEVEEEEMLSPQRGHYDLPVDEEEEKPKPTLQLKYKGFGIYGQCVCIVVEPWPTVRSATRTSQELGGISSRKSTLQQSMSTTAPRAKTPLFLTDNNEMDHGVEHRQSSPTTNPWDDLETMEDTDSDSEMGGMMAFSQAINLAGDNRPGAAEDEDEMEGAVLFGDADEAKQL